MGINAMVVAISAAAGPSVASGILSVASWHWLFAINEMCIRDRIDGYQGKLRKFPFIEHQV